MATITTPNTFIAGAGPVATSLASALRQGGVPVLGLWARNPEQARVAGAKSGVATFSTAPPDLLLEAELVILAVRDEAIGEVAKTLLATGLLTRGHTVLHCAGAISADDAFGAVRTQLGALGTLHPLRAIAEPLVDPNAFHGTVFGIEGDERARQLAIALVTAMDGKPLILRGSEMAAYHAAAALASNYVVAVLDVACDLMVQAGASRDAALAALGALASGSVQLTREHGIEGGLTGPIKRGDTSTVARHLSVLSPEHRQFYRVLAQRTADIAARCDGVTPARVDEIRVLLDADPAPMPHLTR